MIREYDIVSILKKLVSNMEISVKVDSSLDNGDGTFTISTCNTQYLNSCSLFELNGFDYIVSSIENNKSITLSGGPIITDSFNIRPPLFIPDTPTGANNELVLMKNDLDRHPFIWLLENFKTERSFDNRGNIGESRVRLFFLDASDNPVWLEEEIRKNCIEPMTNLADKFLGDLRLKVSGKIETVTVINRIRFGNMSNNKSILDESLSGVEIDITIPVKSWAVDCLEC